MKSISITQQQALGLAIIVANTLNQLDLLTANLENFIEKNADAIEEALNNISGGEVISKEMTEQWVKELITKGLEA